MGTRQRPRTFDPAVVKAAKNGHGENGSAAERKPIELNADGPIGSVLQLALKSDLVKIGLACFLEGGALEGEWGIEVTAARIVPIEPTS